MRASLAMLIGTPGEGTIDTVKSSDLVDKVVFAPVPSGLNADPYAWISVNDQQTALTISVNQKYEYEDPRLLASIVPHEGIHISQANLDGLLDGTNTGDLQPDETIAETVAAATYAQFVTEDPTLAGPKRDAKGQPVIGNNGFPVAQSELQQRRNMALLALVNTRVNGQVRLEDSDSGNVFPNAVTPLSSFTDLFRDLPPIDQDGGPAMQAAVDKLVGYHVPNPRADQATVDVLDKNIHNYFPPQEWVGIMQALQLDVWPYTQDGMNDHGPKNDPRNGHGNKNKGPLGSSTLNQFA